MKQINELVLSSLATQPVMVMPMFTFKETSTEGRVRNKMGCVVGAALAIGAAPIKAPTSPSAIVQRQVDRFNEGNLDAFVACYGDDVEVFALGSATLPPLRGISAFRARYAPMMQALKPRVTILSRQVSGNFVVDKERTVGGGRAEVGLAVYEVNSGRIVRVWFTP